MKTVLIVDRDLGFMAFVSEMLAQAGYLPIPAITSDKATAVLKELENPIIDLLMVDLTLAKTIELARALKKRNRLLKVISIGPTNIGVDAILRKPSPSDAIANDQWLLIVKQVVGE